ncbi:MAG: hypothetical protein COA96_15140 [SAR86 cluster bacterium]|uniref:Guanylate cyclase domain-containing protein n=1 Tax=SAR86 cluster bacterium TaxID=2030880 RepID=A0A2A5ARH4_9GAMM|nr:MAG: hypothetical protein COA96_15140 [SAR86 cluster bacterium]
MEIPLRVEAFSIRHSYYHLHFWTIILSNAILDRNKYSIYCKDHLEEFIGELRDDASLALTSWVGRAVVVLLVLSSILTFLNASALENPYAIYTLFTYSFPILLIVCYPGMVMLFSTIEKYSPLVFDIVCVSVLLGYCLTLELIFKGAGSSQDLDSLYLQLIGQTNFVLLMSIAFSYRSTYWHTLVRNVILSLALMGMLYLINLEYLELNIIQIAQGLLSGTVVSWIFYESIRTRFYLRSTDADTRQHLYNQLSKLVYPHQLERIKLGDELENTMPLKEGKAIVNVFDVQRSSEIKHENTQEFFMGVFQAFLEVCMEGYEHNPLRSRAFRLKETGDGFISSVGYPFLPVDSRSLADSAVSTALSMFEAFNAEVDKFNYSRPIKGAIGLAYNSVQGTFQSGGIRSYDLFGESLVQASKYEELRKQPILWKKFKARAQEIGLYDFNILIVQETVYNSLSPSYRDIFIEVDLNEKEFVESNIEMMYDSEAKYIYFHVLG